MIIQDVIDTARYSELSGSSLKNNDQAIMLFLNAGMLELHKRFQLKTNEEIIALVEGQDIYPLPADYLYYVSAYIPAVDGGDGLPHPLPINEQEEPYSVFFPNHKEIQIVATPFGDHVSLLYVAKPSTYTLAETSQELDLPDTLVEPLLHYIGYKAHLGIKGDANAETNAHYIRFDRSCKKARELGVAHPIDSWQMPSRISDRGFV